MELTQGTAAFIRAHCTPAAPAHAPELSLYAPKPDDPIWAGPPAAFEAMGLAEPFWAFAWSGGQALARFLLDHPETAHGRRVLDVASGGGIAAIAAARAGAASVIATEIDPVAIAAIGLNAALNAVRVEARLLDVLWEAAPKADLILAGDVYYDDALARRFTDWFDARRTEGAEILIGDPGRAFLPKQRLALFTEYRTGVRAALDDAEIRTARVWRFV